MGKREDYSETNLDLSEMLYDEFSNSVDSVDMDKTMKLLPLLLESGLGCKIAIFGYNGGTYYNDYRVACKMIQKYNKKLKEFRKELQAEEFGGSENTSGKIDKRLVKLTKYILDFGTYFARCDENTYMVLKLEAEEHDDDYITGSVWFIGDEWRTYRKEYINKRNKYNQIAKDCRPDYVVSPCSPRGPQEVVFKPIDQFIMKGKDDLLKYIDNWKKNIPLFYDKYSQVAKLTILAYGRPGTGKSTLARSIAKYLGLHYIISYDSQFFGGEQTSDPREARMMNKVIDYKGVSTLDDIDCIARSRDLDSSKENSEVTQKLLQWLDNPPTFNYKAENGVQYPVSIVVATTNYIEKLDDAVKRYGRFDLKLEMPYLDKESAQEMCDLYGIALEDIVPDSNKKNFEISPAELEAKCKENVDLAMKTKTK